MNHFVLPSPILEIKDKFTLHAGVQLYVKRDDLIHPVISGNKWRKLKYNIDNCRKNGYDTILSFGGSYSNHIHALAYAGKLFNLRTIGVIRGEEHKILNPTLKDVTEWGMELYFMDRKTYRIKDKDIVLDDLKKKFGNFYLIPEGGFNKEGFAGCTEIRDEIGISFDYICCAAGTGTTAAGLAASLHGREKLLVFPVLKGAEFIQANIHVWLKTGNQHKMEHVHCLYDYHFGGYAKATQELNDFIKAFYNTHNIPLEPVYTGKLFYGLYDLIKKNFFPKGSIIVALHTGGLQGQRGFLS
ncbi:MAG: pyridoxal-phosphate dependent enzyme [Cytophagaceae bacterium]|nr:pyridoxal-phosphate dependent enzyme [Cytophagaceae bacterium]MDW8455229.1 pyridoxal-phosphate dependent enzyme [Cytophagaceae bacterium]